MSAISQHGTNARYIDGCRCDQCRSAHNEYGRKHYAGTYAGRSELAEWMRGLGWPHRIPMAIPQVFVDRWNREHPERPYIATRT